MLLSRWHTCWHSKTQVLLPGSHSQDPTPTVPILGFHCQGVTARVSLPGSHCQDLTARISLSGSHCQGLAARVPLPGSQGAANRASLPGFRVSFLGSLTSGLTLRAQGFTPMISHPGSHSRISHPGYDSQGPSALQSSNL